MNEFRYHLELSPAQLKIVHTALRSLSDDFGHDQSAVRRVIAEVLEKLPDDHAIRAIELDTELGRDRAVEATKARVNGSTPDPAVKA
jgi:hypothetical protein